MPTAINSTNTVGPLTLAVAVPPDKNYGASATLTVTLQGTLIGAFQFTPRNNQWNVTKYEVGTTMVSFQSNYAPPTGGTIANITISNGSVVVEGQEPQAFSGIGFSWDSSGNVLVPSSAT